MDLISCVITTYKRPTYILKRAIDSIVNQTYKNIELIIVNDAPQEYQLGEDIKTLLEEYKSIPVNYIVHSKNMGACQARNTGIKNARGKFIAFLDDDDEWLPEKIEEQYSLIKDTEIALVYCSHYEIFKNNKPRLIKEPLARTGLNNDEFDRLLRENFIGSTSYPLLRLDIVKQLGGFDVNIKSSQDHELWIRIAKEYPILYCDKPLVNYYCSEISISSDSNNCREGFEYLLNMYNDYYQAHVETYNYRLNYIAYIWFKRKKYKEFFKYKKKAFILKPNSKYNLLTVFKVKNKLIEKLKIKRSYKTE